MFNHFRYLLFLSYLERLFPCVMIHLILIQQGKGYDLQNLLASDMNLLSNTEKYYHFYHLSQEMNTTAFHKYLRKCQQQHSHPQLYQQMMKVFGLFLQSPVHQNALGTGETSHRRSSTSGNGTMLHHNPGGGHSTPIRPGKNNRYFSLKLFLS